MNKNFLDSDEIEEQPSANKRGEVISIFSTGSDTASETYNDPVLSPGSKAGSSAETVRQSGLAYSAGIAFFASVVFMMVIGWGADLLFGSSPWGIVGGIVLGSIIGFVQFFRITSRIFAREKEGATPTSLFDSKDTKN